MNFDITHPQFTVDAHLGIEEVGPCIAIEATGIDDLHPTAVGGDKVHRVDELMLPYVLHELFHKNAFSVPSLGEVSNIAVFLISLFVISLQIKLSFLDLRSLRP